MHVNAIKPNIYEDMLAAARGRNLRRSARQQRVYPYASKRQMTRQRRRAAAI